MISQQNLHINPAASLPINPMMWFGCSVGFVFCFVLVGWLVGWFGGFFGLVWYGLGFFSPLRLHQKHLLKKLVLGHQPHKQLQFGCLLMLKL